MLVSVMESISKKPFHAGTFIVTHSYPGQCQRFAGTLTSVRGIQVPCRHHDQWQRFADIGLYTELYTHGFPRCIIRRLSAYFHVPHQ